MTYQLNKRDLAAIQAEVDARIGAKPDAETFDSEIGWLQWLLETINGAGRVLTLLTAEVVQALAALIIAVVFALLEFQRVHHGAVALGQPDGQAALIAFAVVTANIVHPIYALRELRGKEQITVTVGTVRGSLASFWQRIIGKPVTKELDAYHNPTLHVAAAVITWSTVLLAVYDILGPLLVEVFTGDLTRPVPIAIVELIAGLGLSIAGVFFLQSAAHEIGVRTLTDAPVSAASRLDRAVSEWQQHREELWEETQARYLESKDKAAAPINPFGNTAATADAIASTSTSAPVNGTGGRAKGRMLDEIKAVPDA